MKTLSRFTRLPGFQTSGMILPDGARVYEFHPWEKNIKPIPPYNYVDVPIYDFLEELAARGEDIRDYRTIWYYY